VLKLSVVIPAYNEQGCIRNTLITLSEALESEAISYELIVVNDNSRDQTPQLIDQLSLQNPAIIRIDNTPPNGFGLAVRKGIENSNGEYVAIFMADSSDDPTDLIKFLRKAEIDGLDAVFGNRFISGGTVIDYPTLKLILNRLTNWIISLLFMIRYNDVTNAFKLYRRETLEGLKPYLSHHFNLTVELPLKVVVRGYTYEILPNRWVNRKAGESKLKIKEMGSRYWFIILYCLIEKLLSVGDYKK
tara:strand:+ start:700 stop:1434 length:735 start_codon:yes stop_codon:yes gene_type:complete